MRNISRRTFVRLAGQGAVAGAVGLTLAACSPAAPSTPALGPAPAAGSAPTAASTSGAPAAGATPASAARISKTDAALPSLIATKPLAPPDYAVDDPRVSVGYDRFPSTPAASWTKAPPGSSGSTVNIFVPNYADPPTPRDQNATWKEVERQLNATVQMSMFPYPDYGPKMATLMAGGDLPDIMHIFHAINGAGVPELPVFIARDCADLTPYLTGDAIKDYPNLAAVPTPIWKNSISVLDGKLYQWPIGRPLAFYGLYRDDDAWANAAGQADYVPKDLDDFLRLLRVLNDPRGGRWALGGVPGEPQQAFGAYSFSAIFGAPNNWRLDPSGSLIKDRETEEFKGTVGFLRDAWAEGLLWPDGLTAANTRNALPAGKFAMSWEGFGNSWASLRRAGLAQKPTRRIGWMKPFRAKAGDKPQVFLGAGVTATNVMKKAGPDRIRELLRIVDWLAAPFGSQEYVAVNYGITGQDYTVDGSGNPVPSKAGIANASNVPWNYISRGPFVHYAPDIPGYAKDAVAIEKLHMDFGVFDPTYGYYSATDSGSAGLAAARTFNDGLTSIIVGREPLGAFDALLKDWQRAAGDKIRKEFQDAIAADK